MVAVRRSRSSSPWVWQDTGDVSVMLQQIDTSDMCMSSMQRFITSTGHTAPAITPVRSEERSKESKSGWLGIAMNIVGTPYTPVQLVLDGLQRDAGVEAGRRDHHRRAVGGAAEGLPITMPEAVVEGHRDAQPVLVGEADQLGGEEPVVEDVAVRQRRALGSTPDVLDVDRVGVGQRRHPLPTASAGRPSPWLSNRSQSDVPGRPPARVRERRAGDRDHLVDHRAVVAALEVRRGHRAEPRLVERVEQLVGPVGGVGVTSTAPIFAVAYWTIVHSAQFGDQMPTRSPLAMPAAMSPAPARRRPGRARRRSSAGRSPPRRAPHGRRARARSARSSPRWSPR